MQQQPTERPEPISYLTEDRYATCKDLMILKLELQKEIQDIKLALTIRLGAFIMASTTIITTILGLLITFHK